MMIRPTLLRPILAYALIVISMSLSPITAAAEKRATFAGGCFWCMEHAFEGVKGIISTRVGFIGGSTQNPTYYQVSRGNTGHTEAVEVTFDSDKISYSALLELFWRNIDPLDGEGQFCDRGDQYRPGIFYHDQQQRQQAEKSRNNLANGSRIKGSINTEISPAEGFTKAEEFHQKYYLKNPLRYRFYRYSCGRDQRLQQLWGSSQKH